MKPNPERWRKGGAERIAWIKSSRQTWFQENIVSFGLDVEVGASTNAKTKDTLEIETSDVIPGNLLSQCHTGLSRKENFEQRASTRKNERSIDCSKPPEPVDRIDNREGKE